MICIETSHIYSDENWSEEQEKTLNYGLDVAKKFKKSRLICLVDNYNASGLVDIPAIFTHTVMEGNMTGYAEFTIQMIPQENLKKEVFKKENKVVLFFKKDGLKIPLKSQFKDKEIYHCPLLSLTFHLCRAKLIKNEIFKEKPKKLISILPYRFKPIKDQVLLILNAIKSDVVLEHIFL